MRRKILRRFFIGLAVIFCVVAVLASGVLFIFGEDAAEVFDFKNQKLEVGGGNDVGDIVPLDTNQEGQENGDVVIGSVGSGGSNGGNSEDIGFICSKWQPVQYSLGNFDESIECLVYGVGACERVKMSCSSEVFNLDYELGGIFGIRYSLFYGDDEISFEVIDEDVGARGRVTLWSEIVLDGEFDVGEMECVVDAEKIPARCLD